MAAEFLHDCVNDDQEGISCKIKAEYSKTGSMNNDQRIYLRNLIFAMEEQQIAESIKMVGDLVTSEDGGKLPLTQG